MVSYSIAPMEGITDSRFRNVHATVFGMADRYYTPFIAPTECHRFTAKELRELLPERNNGLNVIPQLLGKNAADMLWAIEELKEMGYRSVNLNIGCPSGTVVKKKKGSGMLSDLVYLRDFLSEVLSHSVLPVSIKSRSGLNDNYEFPEILDLYNSFPISELILHPRYQKQQYSGVPDMDCWDYTVNNSRIPLCYNGNLFSVSDSCNFSKAYPAIPQMIGRGSIAYPGMIREIKYGRKTSLEEMEYFHDELYNLCRAEIGYERAVLLHMKELWFYLSCSFENVSRYLKAIRKSTSYEEYDLAVMELFSNSSLKTLCGFCERGSFD